VMRGLELLKKHRVDFNILCTVHASNHHRPLEVYRFFRDEIGAQFIHFIPIIKPTHASTRPMANIGGSDSSRGDLPLYPNAGNLVAERSVDAQTYGRFLIAIFDEWVKTDVGKVYVQQFVSALSNWVGTAGAVRIFSKTCDQAVALEHNGDPYSCNHCGEPKYKLGDICETHLIQLLTCLCAAYKAFFHHIDGAMKIMVQLLRGGRFADEIMQMPASEKAIFAQADVKGTEYVQL
jgi:uncharacterized protein